MRYTTRINNRKCMEWGINAGQAALFDLLNECAGWAKPMVIGGEVFYWVSRQLVIEELPLFFSKPDTAYRAMKALEEKGLIEYQRSAGWELVRITPKGATWNSHDAVEDDSPAENPATRKNFREVGKISEDSEKNPGSSEKFPSGSEKNPNNSEKFPSNKYINQTTNQGTNPGVCADAPPAPPEPEPPKPKRQSKADEFVAFVVARGVMEATARDWWQYRAGKPMTESAWQRHCTQAEAAGISVQEAAAFAAGKEWRAFYAEGYQREQSDLELARQVGQPFAVQGRTFDQTGREVSPAGVPGMPVAGFGGQSQRTSKMAQGISLLEELKDEIRRGEV